MTAAELAMKRKGANIRQDALARKLGWNAESVIDIERGRVEVTDQTLCRMDEAIEQAKLEKREGVMA